MPRLAFLRAVPPEPRRGGVAVDLALEPGLHAVVGGAADGLLALAPLAGGLVRPRAGSVLIDGRAPFGDADLRRRIGATSSVATLPAIGSVRALIDACARVRGDQADLLARIGVSTLEGRSLGSLSPHEARAVELALALAVPRPLAVVVTEPFADAGDIGRAAVLHALARAAEAGACVVVATASLGDAIDVGGEVHLLEAGRVARSVAAAEAPALIPGRGLELRVVTDRPRELCAALTQDPQVRAVTWNAERASSVVVVPGGDLDAAAIGLARAAAASGARIDAIAPGSPGLDEVRAAAAASSGAGVA